MVRKTYTPEQVITKLREAETQLSQGSKVGEASRKLGVTEQTYYRCGMPPQRIPLPMLQLKVV